MFVSRTTGSQNLNLVRDPFFNDNSLLLHGDGTSGANNSVFLDSSPSNNAITKIGTSTQGTFSPFSTTGWSNQFNGTNQYLSVSATNAFLFDAGNFTIEAWIRPTSVATGPGIANTWQIGGAWGFSLSTSGYLKFSFTNAAAGVSSVNFTGTTQQVTANSWNHVAVVRNGNTITFYVNGFADSTTFNATGMTMYYYNGDAKDLKIGVGADTTNYFPGGISNFRIVKGTAVYTANFTPSTSPLTSVSGTELLTCQSNRFKDNSVNNFSVTPSGPPSVQSFSPLAATKYSKSIFGGSVFFNGTSDYLDVSASNNFYFDTTSNFSIEGWVYPIGPLTSNQVIISTLSTNQGSYTEGQFEVSINAGALTIRYGQTANATGLGGIGGGTVTANVWNYFSYTKSVSGGGTGTIENRLNGSTTTSSSSAAIGTNIFGSNTVGPTVGYRKNSNTSMTYFKGYISDLEIRKYVGSYTPSVPTLPKTPVANTESNGGGTTQFLLKGTNAGIIDSTQKNIINIVGSAQLSSTVSKFGETSMLFNGTTDYLSSPTNTSFDQNVIFTVEFWAYKTGAGTGNGYLYAQNTSGFLTILFNATNNVLIDKSFVGVQVTSSSTFASNAWHHIAMVYDGTNTRLFVNGVLQGTMSGGGAASATTLTIGAYLSGSNFFQGYIDELRVTRGVARYTSNFTPRTGRFPDR